jgi:succinoglycan biosynthesis protein ExoM
MSRPVVRVAVLTYRRTQLLPDLLDALAPQAAEVGAVILVVDNDPDASAAPVAKRWSDRGVRYVHEPQIGISAARNRALDESAEADVLVFIDDDELPSPGWLAHLLDTWSRWRPAAVTGPVPARFLGPVDPWVAGCGLYDRPRRRTGEVLSGAGAGNLLLDLGQLRSLGVRFDERLGLTGGEDTMLTRELRSRGAEIRWCDEAEAIELIPAERLTRQWVMRRSFRSGSSWSRAEIHVAGSTVARGRLRATLVVRAAARIAEASARLLGGVARGDVAVRARALCTVAGHAGLLSGAFGYVPTEYARRSSATTSAPTTTDLTGVAT